jgi:hypothetical protein
VVGCAPSLKYPLFGQIHYTNGDRSARLSFLLPVSSAEQPEMVFLIEALAVQAGGWGAFNLLAEPGHKRPPLLRRKDAVEPQAHLRQLHRLRVEVHAEHVLIGQAHLHLLQLGVKALMRNRFARFLLAPLQALASQDGEGLKAERLTPAWLLALPAGLWVAGRSSAARALGAAAVTFLVGWAFSVAASAIEGRIVSYKKGMFRGAATAAR